MLKVPYLHTLSNGLRVMAINIPHIETSTVFVRGCAGALAEDADAVGVSHLLEHCLFAGTTKYPSRDKLASVVEDLGASYNGSTGFRYVEYYVKSLSKDIEIGFDYLSQLILHPLLMEKDMLHEKDIITREYFDMIDNPFRKFGIDNFRTFFPGQRTAYPISGDVEHIETFDIKRVTDFYSKNYVAENFVVVVVSPLPEAEVLDMGENYFSTMPSMPISPLPDLQPDTLKSYFVRNLSTLNNATLDVVFWAPVYGDEKMYACDHLSAILGEGMLSRLFQKVREELALAYSVGTRYSGDFGIFTVYADIDEEKLDTYITAVLKEISLIQDKIDDSEFQRCKNSILTNSVFFAESTMNIARFYSRVILDNFFPKLNHETYIQRLTDVTKEEVLRVAAEIFSGSPKIGVLSKSIEEKDIRALI